LIRIEWLRAFNEVCKHKGFSEASRQTKIPAVTLSKSVNMLEKHTGQVLFKRSTRKVEITAAGIQFKELVGNILDAYNEIEYWAEIRSKKQDGSLHVISHDAEMLELISRHLPLFFQRYPEMKIDLELVSEQINPDKHTFDIAWGVTSYLGDISPGLIRKKILNTQIGIYASPEYLKRKGYPQHIDDLNQHMMVGYTRNKHNNRLLVNSSSGYVSMESRVCTTYNALALAVDGHGLINGAAELPQTKSLLKAGVLEEVVREYWPKPIELYSYWHKSHATSRRIKIFHDFFIKRIDSQA